MLKQLEELGFIDSTDGQLNEEEKILLLHIYKSKLNGVQPDLKSTYEKIQSKELTAFSQLIDASIGCDFDGDYSKMIEAMHKNICTKAGDAEENYKESRTFDAYEEKMQGIKNVLNEKREKLQTLRSLLGDQQNLKELCQKFGMPSTDENIEMLQAGLKNQYNETQKDYMTNRIKVFVPAVEYRIKSDIRSGKYAENKMDR